MRPVPGPVGASLRGRLPQRSHPLRRRGGLLMPPKAGSRDTRYLIVGNSAGGIGAVEAICEVGAPGLIPIVSDEPYPAYSRPEISEYLAGLTTVERMLFRPSDFYEKNGVEAVLGVAASGLDLHNKRLELDDGRVLAWERLL